MLGEKDHSAANHLFEIDATLLRLADLASKVRALLEDGGEESAALSRRDARRDRKNQGTFRTSTSCIFSDAS